MNDAERGMQRTHTREHAPERRGGRQARHERGRLYWHRVSCGNGRADIYRTKDEGEADEEEQGRDTEEARDKDGNVLYRKES
jgi:hypothetical protein